MQPETDPLRHGRKLSEVGKGCTQPPLYGAEWCSKDMKIVIATGFQAFKR